MYLRPLKRLAKTIFPSLDRHSYLRSVKDVIHVGANTGQERELYAAHNLNVAWVEPLPEAFAELCKNIKPFPKQTAFNHLVTDKDNQEYQFNVANNALSSSILDIAEHREIWPQVHFTSTIALRSITLDRLVAQYGITADALIMDTQGSELLVLKGATKLLPTLKFICTEAADFESYVNCAKVSDLTKYVATYGFNVIRSDEFARSKSGGRYFDLLYGK